MTIRRRLIFFAIAGLMWTSPLAAKPQMTIEVGWGNNYRVGAWNPIFLTVSNPGNRQVVMELSVPVSGADSMDIRQSFVIGPSPATYALYSPLPQTYQLAESTITLRDAVSNRRLDDAMPLADPTGRFSSSGPATTPNQIWSGQTFLGHSGRSATRHGVEQQFTHHQITVGHLPIIRLPEAAVGYQCLEALVLDAPDLSKITPQQQAAIAEWVRAGGTVIMWPSEDPLPASGPLVDMLPVRFGENRAIELSAEQQRAAQLRDRSRKLRTRLVTPAADAEPVTFFDNAAATGYRQRVGLGTILVLPFDAASLQFTDDKAELRFWRAALKDILELPPDDPTKNNNNVYGRGSIADQRRQHALTTTLDWLGDIPGAGAFGFSYVAFVLIGMMIIVGPVDWFVLKWLGRQPWTWVTTSGWIAMVTLGSIFVGSLFKSGDLHYRTVRLMDQVENTTVADLTVAGVYSPSTTNYQIACNPESWWQPASETMYYGRQGRAVELPSHQDYRGTRPISLPVNVWNLRFIEGHSLSPGAPLVAGDLSSKEQRLQGTVRNLSEVSLTELRFRTGAAAAAYAGPPIPPGQSIEIDLPLEPRGSAIDSFTPSDGVTLQPPNPLGNQSVTIGSVEPTPWTLAGLAPDRSMRIDTLLKRGGHVCITASLTPAQPAAQLQAEGIIHKHVAVLRAVLPLND